MESLSESAWVRGWSDTKKGIGTWQFWLLEVFGGGLMAIFVNPTAALILILGMAVAVWISATASAPIKQRNELRLEVNSRPENAGRFPDMSLVDLFYHLNSEVLEDDHWLHVGKEIRDMASIGRLVVWGRASRPGFVAALEKVEPAYWLNADFNYRFFANDSDEAASTTPGVGQAALMDVQVNKQQVDSIWPPKDD